MSDVCNVGIEEESFLADAHTSADQQRANNRRQRDAAAICRAACRAVADGLLQVIRRCNGSPDALAAQAGA